MSDQTPTIGLVPLDQLYLHPFNPRQEVPEEDTDAIAESIAINGLMQNLSGFRDPERDGVGIVAGGRRWRGLLKLQAEGWSRHPDVNRRYDQVPVQITDDPLMARSWSLAENVTHLDLHPADEVRAYREMAAQGSSPEMIARAFAKSAVHVQRRLRLAQLPEEALDALKANRISIDVARALTLSDDEGRVLAALDAAAAGRGAEWVRRELAEGTIRSSDRRARYVGLAAYEGAGGRATRDLFEGHHYLHDEALLERLFDEKLEADAGRVGTDEGWQWVKTTRESYVDWAEVNGRPRLHPQPVELPAADLEELERLQEMDDRLDADQEARLDELEERAAGTFSDEDKAQGGVLVYVDHAGKLQVSRAYGPAPKAARDSEGDDDGAPAPAEPKSPPIAAACVEDLNAVRLHVLQSALVDKTNLMLDLLAYSLETGAPGYRLPLAVSLEQPKITPEKPAGFEPDTRLTGIEAKDYQAQADWKGFEAFRDKGQKHRNAVLALHLARAIQPSDMWRDLWREAGADMRSRWTPSAEALFSRMRGDQLAPLWRQLTALHEEDTDFEKMKKRDQAKELEALFTDMAKREALGLDRETNAKIDAWVPQILGLPGEDA